MTTDDQRPKTKDVVVVTDDQRPTTNDAVNKKMNQLRTKISLALLLSVLIHIGMTIGVWYSFGHISPAELPSTEAIQIVDLTLPANEIKPKKAKFVGTKDNRVSEETVARPKPRKARSSTKKKGVGARTKIAKKSRRKKKGQSPEMKRPAKRRPAPATALVSDMAGGTVYAIPDDYFPNYKHGGRTYVNVLRHPNVGYFVELKRAIKMAWNPLPPLRRAGRQIWVGRNTIKVVVGVTVDPAGNLQELFILRGSGIGAYDREALRTFRATFPYFAAPAYGPRQRHLDSR